MHPAQRQRRARRVRGPLLSPTTALGTPGPPERGASEPDRWSVGGAERRAAVDLAVGVEDSAQLLGCRSWRVGGRQGRGGRGHRSVADQALKTRGRAEDEN